MMHRDFIVFFFAFERACCAFVKKQIPMSDFRGKDSEDARGRAGARSRVAFLSYRKTRVVIEALRKRCRGDGREWGGGVAVTDGLR
jgi:hypothetical protein